MKHRTLLLFSALILVCVLTAGSSTVIAGCRSFTPEQAGAIVNEVYLKVLKRKADPSGLVTFGGQISNGKGAWCIWRVVTELAVSPEYASRFIHNQTPRQAIILMYRNILLREPESEQAINNHVNDLNGRGWIAKARDFSRSGESSQIWERVASEVLARGPASAQPKGDPALREKGCKFFLGRANDYLCTTQQGYDLCKSLKKQGKSDVARCQLAGVNEEADTVLTSVGVGCIRVAPGQYSCSTTKGLEVCSTYRQKKMVQACTPAMKKPGQ